jgi:hypothetical protein
MRRFIGLASFAFAAAATAQPPAPSRAPNACSETTKAALHACVYDALDTFWIGVGKCHNEAQADEQKACIAEARSTLTEDQQDCRDQREARATLCSALGEAPYDPRFEPADFVDPRTVGGSVAPNPWFPLIVGRTMVYRGEDGTDTVKITSHLKVIDDVPCVAVRDTLKAENAVIEDTIDWFAQDVRGNVWYCGEATAEYENGFPANVDGSFQADVDGARPGLIMKAAPAVGDVYRQEFDLGNAEDAAKVVNLHGSARVPAGSCARTCLVTEETTALEPDARESKYYEQGIGLILEVDLETGQRTELVEVTND